MNTILINKIIKQMQEENNNNLDEFVKRLNRYLDAEKNQISLTHINMRPEKYIKGLMDFCECFPRDWEILEIGVYAGEGTRIFSEYFKTVYAIDPWKVKIGETESESVELYTKNLRAAELSFDELCEENKNIIKLKGFDTEFLNMFDENSLDIVYIDADHRYEAVKENIINWFSKVKVGGFISGHDYHESTPGVIKAVNELLGKTLKTFEDNSWYQKKEWTCSLS